MIKTEYEFTLPVGYQDDEGTLHRDGVMRLSTAADEINPLKDVRVQANPAYLIVILLSRVITRLGSLQTINHKVIMSLYVADFAYLQSLYNEINQVEKYKNICTCLQCWHERHRVKSILALSDLTQNSSGTPKGAP